MVKHVAELTTAELREIGRQAAQDASRRASQLGLPRIGAFPDGTLYRVEADGALHLLTADEAARLERKVTAARTSGPVSA